MNPFRLRLLRFLILSAVLAALLPRPALAAFDCAGKNADQFTAVCHDAELMRLDRAVDASLARARHAVDPVTAMLLQRDQNWTADIAGGAYAEFKGADDPARQRIIAVLQGRLAMLDHLASRADGVVGEWSDAFGTAQVTAQPDGSMRVDIRTKVVYGDDSDPVACALIAKLKPGDDGWLSGPAARVEDVDDPPAIAPDLPITLRARQQANTLRIVVVHSDDEPVCDRPENLTASYFPVATASSAAGQTRRRR